MSIELGSIVKEIREDVKEQRVAADEISVFGYV